MKLMISADIEGTAGIATWEETTKGNPEYTYFRQQMTKEVSAACRGAQDSKRVDEILVKDAHDSACNIIPEELPKEVKLMRSWECAPGGMVSGIREGVDALAMTGYHSAAYTAGSPLAHTQNGRNQYIKLNGKTASEFMLNSYTAAYYGASVVFISGDRCICESAKELCPNIETAVTGEGYGGAIIGIHPEKAQELIYEGMKKAMQKDLKETKLLLPEHFTVEIEFKEYQKAYRGGFYPGAKRVGSKGLAFENDDYYEILRFLYFTL